MQECGGLVTVVLTTNRNFVQAGFNNSDSQGIHIPVVDLIPMDDYDKFITHKKELEGETVTVYPGKTQDPRRQILT